MKISRVTMSILPQEHWQQTETIYLTSAHYGRRSRPSRALIGQANMKRNYRIPKVNMNTRYALLVTRPAA
jgi:hypothetical protein